MHIHWTLVLLCVYLVSRVSSQADCSNLKLPSGEVADLSPVVGKVITTNDGFSDYKVAVCQDSLSCGGCSSAGFCQTNEFFSDCLGKFSGVSVMTDGTIQLLYDEGDWGNSGQLKLKCNPAAEEFMNVKGEQFYKVTYAETKYACPKSGVIGGLSVGSVIMIIIAVGLVVYLLVGVIWNKYREEKEGAELLPNKDFWVGLPGLVTDGITFTVGKIKNTATGGDGL